MNDNDDASDFEVSLEHLRQVSRVYLPQMADYYGGGAGAMTDNLSYGADSYGSASMFLETADFLKGDGGEAMATKWSELADLFIAALGKTGNTYWYTAQVLDWALDAFVEQDGANAETLKELRDKAEASGINDEYSGDFKPVDVPEYEKPEK